MAAPPVVLPALTPVAPPPVARLPVRLAVPRVVAEHPVAASAPAVVPPIALPLPAPVVPKAVPLSVHAAPPPLPPPLPQPPPLEMPVIEEPVAAQAPAPGETPIPLLRLTPPTPEVLFRLEAESALRTRIQQEAAANPKLPRPEFPGEKAAAAAIAPRQWPWYTKQVEPTYLCYGRLFFQQVAFERYGASFGAIQPMVSAGLFYTDLLAFPLRAMLWPCRPYECSTINFSPFFDGWPPQR